MGFTDVTRVLYFTHLPAGQYYENLPLCSHKVPKKSLALVLYQNSSSSDRGFLSPPDHFAKRKNVAQKKWVVLLPRGRRNCREQTSEIEGTDLYSSHMCDIKVRQSRTTTSLSPLSPPREGTGGRRGPCPWYADGASVSSSNAATWNICSSAALLLICFKPSFTRTCSL